MLETELRAIIDIILQRIIIASFNWEAFIKPLPQNLVKLAALQHFHNNTFHSIKKKDSFNNVLKEEAPWKMLEYLRTS